MDKSLEVGDSWATQIEREIQRADLVIVLISPDVNREITLTQRRSFMLNEIDYAQQLNKPILPVMAEKTYMPVQLAGIQYIDIMSSDYVSGVLTLVGRIVEHVRQYILAKSTSTKSVITSVSPTNTILGYTLQEVGLHLYPYYGYGNTKTTVLPTNQQIILKQRDKTGEWLYIEYRNLNNELFHGWVDVKAVMLYGSPQGELNKDDLPLFEYSQLPTDAIKGLINFRKDQLKLVYGFGCLGCLNTVGIIVFPVFAIFITSIFMSSFNPLISAIVYVIVAFVVYRLYQPIHRAVGKTVDRVQIISGGQETFTIFNEIIDLNRVIKAREIIKGANNPIDA